MRCPNLNNLCRILACCLGASMLLIGGCATTNSNLKNAPIPQPAQLLSVDGKVQYVLPDDPHIRANWQEVNSAVASKDWYTALYHAERGLQLDPKSAAMWSVLAEVQLNLQQYKSAESSAIESSLLAQNTAALQYRNWSMIAYARHKLGDPTGVRSAMQQVDRYASPGQKTFNAVSY